MSHSIYPFPLYLPEQIIKNLHNDQRQMGQNLWERVNDYHSIKIGAHLVTPRIGYSHHGIYVGDGKVVHYSGYSVSANDTNTGQVEETTFDAFSAGKDCYIKKHERPKFSADEIVSRARSRIAESRYSIVFNNCEHFCEWCINNVHRSEQLEDAEDAIGLAVEVGVEIYKAKLSTTNIPFPKPPLPPTVPIPKFPDNGPSRDPISVIPVGAAVGLGAMTSGVALLGAVPGIATAAPVAAAAAVGYGIYRLVKWFND